MKKIVNIPNGEEVKFNIEDLPMMVHAKEHSGGSLLSITLASLLHAQGITLCIFTAYSMAKDEFLNQIKDPEKVFYLENEEDISKALQFQTIIVQSGNVPLFVTLVSNPNFLTDRIIFVKNVETINEDIYPLLQTKPLIISGDLELNELQKDFKNIDYKTKILFNDLGELKVLNTEKYKARLFRGGSSQIVSVKV